MVAVQILMLIRELYAIERGAAELEANARRTVREARAAPLLESVALVSILICSASLCTYGVAPACASESRPAVSEGTRAAAAEPDKRDLTDLRRLADAAIAAGKRDDARRHVEAMEELVRDKPTTREKANVLLYCGDFNRNGGEVPDARRRLSAAYDAYRELHASDGMAVALLLLAELETYTDKETARTYGLGARQLYGEIHDQAGEGKALSLLAFIERISRDPAAAYTYKQALRLNRSSGDRL